ncbi:hypothetical protein [Paenibacillus mendelii]|uniref:Beta-galactosidase trimerisation domain-containing protein n=1 Tax=Paenibacillus mendelii TaxID=206163 RepID=A0ABV6JGN3_9BACL|nr:hypothetical protein [Paenibacillus mendelii]MCQ6557478.1 hypothetical protein [Paenibacillus mendelii]
MGNGTGRSLTGYVYEDEYRREANAEGRNYWYRYVEELFDELGLRAAKLSRGNLLDNDILAGLTFIVIGDIRLSAHEKECLQHWMAGGGVLIGFATREAEALFGIVNHGTMKQPDDEFTISGFCRFAANVPEELNPLYDFKGASLPIFSDLELVKPVGGELADSTILMDSKGQETEYSAVVHRQVGLGESCYFAFDLPQTIWVIHQGRPVVADLDGDGYFRSSDNIVLGRSLDLELPYADYWLQVLEQALIKIPQPFIHQLPPQPDGAVPDMVLHYGGDDECQPGIQVKASDYMKDKGLPYHINLMPDKNGNFAINTAEYDEIVNKNGHDLSLHFDFVKPLAPFTEAELQEQAEQYVAAFGIMPIATVNHWTMATGWAEMARWASALGMKGDNSRVHVFSPPANPINLLGFGFGSAYPHFVYDDFEHDNIRIPYVYIPINLFEPRIYDETRQEDVNRIHAALDRAAYFGWTLNVFIHPVYIADEAGSVNCLPAIEEILQYARKKGYSIRHLSTNGICQWWFDRSQTALEIAEWKPALNGEEGASSIRFTVETDCPEGVLVKLPLPGKAKAASYEVRGLLHSNNVLRWQNGRLWTICHIPMGKQDVTVKFD